MKRPPATARLPRSMAAAIIEFAHDNAVDQIVDGRHRHAPAAR
jgi:hypothetical protein